MIAIPKFKKELLAVEAKKIAMVRQSVMRITATLATVYMKIGGPPVVWPDGSNFDVILPDLKKRFDEYFYHELFRAVPPGAYTPQVDYLFSLHSLSNAKEDGIDISITMDEIFVVSVCIMEKIKKRRPEVHALLSYLFKCIINESPCITTRSKYDNTLGMDPEYFRDAYDKEMRHEIKRELKNFNLHVPYKWLGKRKEKTIRASLPLQVKKLGRKLNKAERRWITETINYLNMTEWPREDVSFIYADYDEAPFIENAFYFMWDNESAFADNYYLQDLNDQVGNYGYPRQFFTVTDQNGLKKAAAYLLRLSKLIWIMHNWEKTWIC